MKKVSFIFFLIVTQQLISQNKEILDWEASRPLSWEDFNGKPEKRFAAASTHYDTYKSIKKESEHLAIISIKAVFFTNASWKKIQWINDEVLQHEQLHFDIVELFARKLRKRLSEGNFKSYSDLQEKFDLWYREMENELDIYQDLYDEESDGSMNGKEQRRWENKVKAEIIALDAFKENTIKVKF